MVQKARVVEVLVDHDFVNNMEISKKIVFSQLQAAVTASDDDQVRYLRGILRGIEMVQETYLLCLDHEVRKPVPSPVETYSFAVPSIS